MCHTQILFQHFDLLLDLQEILKFWCQGRSAAKSKTDAKFSAKYLPEVIKKCRRILAANKIHKTPQNGLVRSIFYNYGDTSNFRLLPLLAWATGKGVSDSVAKVYEEVRKELDIEHAKQLQNAKQMQERQKEEKQKEGTMFESKVYLFCVE